MFKIFEKNAKDSTRECAIYGSVNLRHILRSPHISNILLNSGKWTQKCTWISPPCLWVGGPSGVIKAGTESRKPAACGSASDERAISWGRSFCKFVPTSSVPKLDTDASVGTIDSSILPSSIWWVESAIVHFKTLNLNWNSFTHCILSKRWCKQISGINQKHGKP